MSDAEPTTVEVDIKDLRELLDLHMREMGGDVCHYDASWDEIDLIRRLYALVKPSLAEFCREDI